MILLNNVNLPLNTDFSDLVPIASRELKAPITNIKSAKLYRKSVDARKKNDVHFCCSLIIEVLSNEEKIIAKCKNAQKYEYKPYIFKKTEKTFIFY